MELLLFINIISPALIGCQNFISQFAPLNQLNHNNVFNVYFNTKQLLGLKINLLDLSNAYRGIILINLDVLSIVKLLDWILRSFFFSVLLIIFISFIWCIFRVSFFLLLVQKTLYFCLKSAGMGSTVDIKTIDCSRGHGRPIKLMER